MAEAFALFFTQLLCEPMAQLQQDMSEGEPPWFCIYTRSLHTT